MLADCQYTHCSVSMRYHFGASTNTLHIGQYFALFAYMVKLLVHQWLSALVTWKNAPFLKCYHDNSWDGGDGTLSIFSLDAIQISNGLSRLACDVLAMCYMLCNCWYTVHSMARCVIVFGLVWCGIEWYRRCGTVWQGVVQYAWLGVIEVRQAALLPICQSATLHLSFSSSQSSYILHLTSYTLHLSFFISSSQSSCRSWHCVYFL